MKVFFTCSARSIEKHAKYYRKIRNTILSLGHKLSRDWIDYSINTAQRGTLGVSSHTFYKDVMSAILTADVVVVDASIRSMAVGHQTTYALLKGKPVLLMRHKKKGQKSQKMFIEGSESKEFNVNEYESIRDIEKILKKFFSKYEKKSITRFNLALIGDQDSYISWASFNYKKTKTEIIQEAIDSVIEKDIVYKKYLDRQS